MIRSCTKLLRYNVQLFNFSHNCVILSRNKICASSIQVHLNIPSITFRPFSGQSNLDSFTVDFEHVQKATSNDKIFIIDVREPDEIKEHGKIPNSINIPLGNVYTALSTMTNKEFEKNYNRPKPSEESEIIFYCMIGKRSGMAQENAASLGYQNVKNYVGSWTDWAKNMH